MNRSEDRHFTRGERVFEGIERRRSRSRMNKERSSDLKDLKGKIKIKKEERGEDQEC